MNKLTNFQIEYWKDEQDGALRMFFKAKCAEPLRYISLLLVGSEVKNLTKGTQAAFQDIGHRLDIMGERWTFYDLGCPTTNSGTMAVPYQVVNVPDKVRQILTRYVRKYATTERKTLELTPALVRRYLTRYGNATGKVQYKLDEETRNYLKARLASDKRKLARCLQNVTRIARNSTYSKYQTATVRLCKEYGEGGFYWEAYTPEGKRRMNGGIIDHGEVGAPSWSVHT